MIREQVNQLLGEPNGPRPVEAVRQWVVAGGPAESAPSEVALEAFESGPTSVELTIPERRAVEDALTLWPDEREGAPADVVEGLVSRGILIRAVHGVAIAPAYLWTLGIMEWATRHIDVRRTGGPVGPADNPWFGLRIIGERAVQVQDDGTSTVVSRSSLPSLQQRFATLLGGGVEPAASALEIFTFWPEVQGRGWDIASEEIDVTNGPDGVVWTVRRDESTEASTVELTQDQAKERLRAVLHRGAEADERTAAEARTVAKWTRRSRWNPVTSSTRYGNYVAGHVLDEVGLGKRSLAVHAERARRMRAEEYWRMPPSFVRRQR